MKLTISCMVFVMLLVPFQPACAAAGAMPGSRITLTGEGLDGANDIEAAIINATAGGTRPGTVILDGQEGPFVFTDADRSLNIFVSNLILMGTNDAVIEGCDDGLFFDDFALSHIRVEGITFLCSGDGVEASGAFEDVILRSNHFRTRGFGITTGGFSTGWQITGNLIQSDADGIRMTGAADIKIADNQISGAIGVVLMQTSRVKVRRNTIQAGYQGVLLGQESWNNTVQSNAIQGVAASGIALEPGVTGNRIIANTVECSEGSLCLTVDALPEVWEENTIARNRP